MVIGAHILAIAITDHLAHLIFSGHHSIDEETVDQSHVE
jgi:hypothetical protein